jgi:hypothetical protein
VGDSLLNGSAAPEDEETPLRERWSRRQVLYLEMRYERSRHKYRVEVPLTVIQQFHWLLGLCRHEAGSAQAIIEA